MRELPHVRLRDLREKRFSSQKSFCSYAQKNGHKIASRRYGGIERGDINPTIDDVIAICYALEISADTWLFGRREIAHVSLLSDAELDFVERVTEGLVALRVTAKD